MMNSRHVFSFDGLLGFIVAIIVLFIALVFLMYFAIGTQNNNAVNYYEIKNEKSIKMFDKDNAKHIIDVKGA
ncbi:MAG TPA: DUF4006 family protein [Sulfurimonas sp.]|nr:DUF4006 family protein [Sulfurimonas sp.]HIM75349.1 DUF4006 family protein [Campylobacterales bacterium]